MKFFSMFFVAWVASWLALLSNATDPVFDFGYAAVMGVIFASVTWLFARRSNYKNWIPASGWMLIVIAVVGFGDAYDDARRAGLERGDAKLDAFIGSPALLTLVAAGMIIYGKLRKPQNEG